VPSGSSFHTFAASTAQAAAVSASSPATAPPVDLAALAAAQQSCQDCQRAASSSVLRVTTIQMDNTSIMVDTSAGVFRPLVPAAFRRPIFEAIHCLAHPGIRASRRLIASRFVWPGLASQVAAWCRDCLHCQRAKASRQPHTSPQAITNPLQRFSHLHIDLVGPLPPSSDGFSHLLTIVDRSTRWAEAIPLRSTTADSCAAALVQGWVARFGVPQQITSDRGVQFTSSVWSSFVSRLGIKSKLTTPYHPQANGAVEHFHCRLKDSLRARLAGSDWPAHLPWVMLGLRAAPREDSGISAAELVYGCPLSLPGQFLTGSEPSPVSFLHQLNSSLPCVADNSHIPSSSQAAPQSLREAAFVYVRSPPVSPALAPAYRGPYRVLVPGDKYFVLEVGGQLRPFSASNLKPHLGRSPIAPAPTPRRGRPRRPSPVLSLAPQSRLGGGGGSVEAAPSGSRKIRQLSAGKIRE
jgi:transposase InsO family protein